MIWIYHVNPPDDHFNKRILRWDWEIFEQRLLFGKMASSIGAYPS